MGFPNTSTQKPIITIQQSIVMYECKSRKNDEFLEFGRENHSNRALDRKIWALEALKGKTVFSGGSRGICGIEWLESLGGKEQELLWSLGNFWGFLECLEWFRTYLYLFFEVVCSEFFMLTGSFIFGVVTPLNPAHVDDLVASHSICSIQNYDWPLTVH
jgi:hypothetical protein